MCKQTSNVSNEIISTVALVSKVEELTIDLFSDLKLMLMENLESV